MIPMIDSRVVLVLFAVIFVGSPGVLEAQGETDRRRNLVQKPLAVAKLTDIGYPDWQVDGLVDSLTEAGVTPSEFNAVVGSIPYLAGMLSSLEGAVNHVILKQERGMNGDELVRSVRTELREQELPWKTGLPTNNDYLGESSRNIISRVKESVRNRRGFEEGDFQPAEGKPGSRPPARPGPGPAPGPGPGGPGQPY